MIAALLLTLATSQAVGPAQGGSLTLTPAPLITIGEEGRPEYEFTQVDRAVQLPSGELAVSDARAREVRIFGPDGEYRRTLGRAGAGPGEFRSVTLLPPAGDTVLVWDAPLRRLTRYVPDGTLAGTVPVVASSRAQRISLVGRLSSQRWVVSTFYTPSLMRPSGLYRDSLRVGTIPASGAGAVSWTRWYPGATFWVYKPVALADHAELVGVALFSSHTHVAVHGDHIIVGDGSTREILVTDADGRIVRRLSVPFTRRPISDDALRRLRRDAVASAPNAETRARAEMYYSRAAVAPATPVFGGLAVTPAGELWVTEFVADDASPRRAAVLTATGTLVGTVTLPPRSRVLDAGMDFVWLAVADADGIERIEKYGVRR